MTLALDPANYDAKWDLALLLVNLGRIDESSQFVKPAIQTPNEDPVIRYIYGRILLARRTFEDATREFDYCLSRKFKIRECLGHLAEISDALGDGKAAREFRKRQVELQPASTGTD